MARHAVAFGLLALINFLTLLCSIPLIVVALWLLFHHHTDCLSFLQWPILFIGLATFVVSLFGLLGSVQRSAPLLWIYLVLLFLIILLLLSFTLFSFFVTSGGGGHHVSHARYLEYRLGDYSVWFQTQVTNAETWGNLKQCVRDKQACHNLNDDYPTLSDFRNADLSPIQSGCCKPPNACGFRFVTPTIWENATRPSATSDCGRWESSPYQLCYDCDSCRAGLLETMKKAWVTVAKVCLVVLILVVILYMLAWFAFVTASWEDLAQRHGFSRRT